MQFMNYSHNSFPFIKHLNFDILYASNKAKYLSNYTHIYTYITKFTPHQIILQLQIYHCNRYNKFTVHRRSCFPYSWPSPSNFQVKTFKTPTDSEAKTCPFQIQISLHLFLLTNFTSSRKKKRIKIKQRIEKKQHCRIDLSSPSISTTTRCPPHTSSWLGIPN